MTTTSLNDCLDASRHGFNEFFETDAWDSIPSSDRLCPEESLLIFLAFELENVLGVRVGSLFRRKPKMLYRIEVRDCFALCTKTRSIVYTIERGNGYPNAQTRTGHGFR